MSKNSSSPAAALSPLATKAVVVSAFGKEPVEASRVVQKGARRMLMSGVAVISAIAHTDLASPRIR